MIDYTPAGQEMANRLLVERGHRKDLGIERLCNELGELRAKVETLEKNSKQTSNENQTRRLLLERVHSCIVGEPECGHMQARAAIREVAAWLREHAGGTRAAWLLEQQLK